MFLPMMSAEFCSSAEAQRDVVAGFWPSEPGGQVRIRVPPSVKEADGATSCTAGASGTVKHREW